MSHFIIVGLGNPGSEYENTRHNTGRILLEAFRQAQDFPEWSFDKKLKALVSVGQLATCNLQLILPETFMNKSGDAMKNIQDLRFKIQAKKKEISNLAVIHDDLDIPFGKFKISWSKSSGGHRGVESIIKAVKTESFVRIRVGISPTTPSGKMRKPHGEVAVDKHILGKFSPGQLATLKKLSKSISDALVTIVAEGREKAMSQQGSF